MWAWRWLWINPEKLIDSVKTNLIFSLSLSLQTCYKDFLSVLTRKENGEWMSKKSNFRSNNLNKYYQVNLSSHPFWLPTVSYLHTQPSHSFIHSFTPRYFVRSSSGSYKNGKKEGNTNRFQSMALTRDDVGWEMNGGREKTELTGNQHSERKETKENVSREERMTMSDWWGKEWQERGDETLMSISIEKVVKKVEWHSNSHPLTLPTVSEL